MARKKNIVIEKLTVEDVGSEGKSVAKRDGMVYFIEGAVPGDVIDLQVTRKKSSFRIGRAIHFHEYSKDRTDPICPHFGLCGGCKWQQLPYEKQLFYKQKQVVDNLERIGKLTLPEIAPILASEQTQFYRNKLEFTFTENRWLTAEEIEQKDQLERRGAGFHLPGKFDRVMDIEQCYLQSELSNQVRNGLRDFAIAQDFTFYHHREHTGLLRNLIVRTASTSDLMVIVQFGEKQPENIEKAMAYLKESFPAITSLQYIVNTKKNDSWQDQQVICYAGVPYITEEMEGLQFRVGAKSFYQTNSAQAYELYKVTRDFANLSGDEVVYDLYTGTGTIAQFVSAKAKQVIGLEYVEMAIEDAKENADRNGIGNCQFYAGDIKELLTDAFFAQHPAPDVIITDPPRAGMHADVVKRILQAAPQKVVYVSCNPATQARDLQLLDEKYEVKKVQPVDMFPHTYHVENVCLLELR